MRAKEFTIKEDDLDNLLQAKGLAPKTNSAAQEFANALDAEDDIAKLASGKIDAKTLHKQDRPGVDPRTTGPSSTVQGKAIAVPTQNITPKSLPPIKTATAPAPVAKPKIEIKQASGSVPWQDIAHYCKSKWNMTTDQIAGILANIKVESRFFANDLHTDSNGLPAGGLFSHNGPRLQQLINSLGPNWKSNWQGQIDFALKEPDGARYIAKQYPNADAASRAWTIGFERPAKAKVQAAKRAPAARQYASNL
jgi:hypothetical protein